MAVNSDFFNGMCIAFFTLVGVPAGYAIGGLSDHAVLGAMLGAPAGFIAGIFGAMLLDANN